MIARLWKGWTTPENADAYERFVRGEILPQITQIDGCHGAYVLRHEQDTEVEFAVMILFASMDSVRAFAGEDFTVPVIEPEARQLLTRVEPVARHYEVKAAPNGD